MPDRPNPLGEMLRNYRQLANLTQRQLAELMLQLFDEGAIRAPLVYQHIGDIERGRYRAPLDTTLDALAIALSRALQAEGFEGATVGVIRQNLYNSRMAPGQVDVPPRLLVLLAKVSAYPSWYGDMIFRLAELIHDTISSALDNRLRAVRKKRDTVSSHDDSDVASE